MDYLLACREGGRTIYLSTNGINLTEHRERAQVFRSQREADEMVDKWNRRRKRLGKQLGDSRKLYLMPLRTDPVNIVEEMRTWVQKHPYPDSSFEDNERYFQQQEAFAIRCVEANPKQAALLLINAANESPVDVARLFLKEEDK